MNDKVRGILKNAGKILLGFSIWFGSCLAWLAWETHKVSSFCADVRPGMPISSLTNLAEKRGIDQAWIRGFFDEKKGDWSIYVPISATMGERGCSIRHDGKVIQSARMPNFL